MNNPFRKPHPFIFNVGSFLLPGFIVFLLILVFVPFGFSVLEFTHRLVLSAMFGLISCFGVLLVIGLFKWIAPGFMQDESWTVGKEIILVIMVVAGISLLNFGVILTFGLSEAPIPELFKLVVLYTLGISIIPVGILVLFEQFTHQRKKLLQAQRLTTQLRQQKASNPDENATNSNPILFEDENGNIELQLLSKEVLFLKSEGNYAEIYYLNSGQSLQKKLIRNRLKNFEDILPKIHFFRTHKSYIVNIMHIIQVVGNARNLELILRGSDQRIPVSRSKTGDLTGILKDD